MRIAYLINVHKNFEQLGRLVDKLNNNETDLFIHIDKKVDSKRYALLLDSLKKYHVTLVSDRDDIKWSGFTQVEATIIGLRTILMSEHSYDYINFISGQDYPVMPNNFILDYLSNNKGYEFIEYCELSPNGWAGAMIRFERYWLHEKIRCAPILLLIQHALTVLFPKRKIPKGYKAYGGSSWWTISSDCARFIIDFVDREKNFVDFFRLTSCADEMFFQTILINSNYKAKICNNNLRYIDWSECKNNPKVLSKVDFNHIVSSNKLFAIKFDSNFDDEILNMLDEYQDSAVRRTDSQVMEGFKP